MGEMGRMLEILSIVPCIFKGSLTVLRYTFVVFFKKFEIPTMSQFALVSFFYFCILKNAENQETCQLEVEMCSDL